MQKLLIFSVYDEKAEAYLQPFYFTTVNQAIRAITDCVADPNHNFNRHASDFTLFQIGTFFDDTGKIANEVPKSLGNLIEFKADYNNSSKEAIPFPTKPEVTK